MEKKCENCKQVKPLTDFYFRKETGKYRGNCKKCKPVNSKKDIQDRLNSGMKVCKHCGINKPISEYHKAGGGKWAQPYCKPCDAIRKKEYGINNIEKVKDKQKRYYEENKSIISERAKKYRTKNIDSIKSRAKSYRQKNLEDIKIKQNQYAKDNREKITKKRREKRQANKEFYQEKGRQLRASRTPEQIEAKRKYDREYKIKNKDKYIKWRKENADKVREQKRIWGNKKSATDVNFKIKKNIRTRIRCALLPNNSYKVDKSEKLLGCTIEFFRNYLESLFTEGMNWDKFLSADIEIDHIKPCAKFDLSKEEEQRKCFHYTNCQPLWWYDNNKKGATYQEQY